MGTTGNWRATSDSNCINCEIIPFVFLFQRAVRLSSVSLYVKVATNEGKERDERHVPIAEIYQMVVQASLRIADSLPLYAIRRLTHELLAQLVGRLVNQPLANEFFGINSRQVCIDRQWRTKRSRSNVGDAIATKSPTTSFCSCFDDSIIYWCGTCREVH